LLGSFQLDQEQAVLLDLNLEARVVLVGVAVVGAAAGSQVLDGPLADELLLELVGVADLLEGEGKRGVDPEGEVQRGGLLVLRDDEGVAARHRLIDHSLERKFKMALTEWPRLMS